jgi:peptidoglycan/LPS O-acetylase OafA/YrhL
MIGLAWNFTYRDGWITGFFIEYWPHFALGSILYFVLCESAFTRARAPFLVASAFLGIVCATHVISWHQTLLLEPAGRVYGELLLLSGLSIALVLMRPVSERLSSSLLWRPVAAIGTISYSLYLIHQFNLTLVGAAARLLVPINAPTPLLVMTQIILHLILAGVFWYWCERPFLTRRTVALSPSVAVNPELQTSARD